MLESGGDKSRYSRDDYHSLLGDAAGAERHPYREAHQHVAEHGKEEQLHRRQGRLGGCDSERRLANGVVLGLLPGLGAC